MPSLPSPCGTSPDPETCRQEEPRQVSALQPDSPPSVWGPGPPAAATHCFLPRRSSSAQSSPILEGGKSICAGCGGDSRVPLKGGGSIRSRWVCRGKKETFSFCHPPTTALTTLSVLFLFCFVFNFFSRMSTHWPSSSAHLSLQFSRILGITHPK